MKAFPPVLALLASAVCAAAQTQPLIYQPRPATTVVSPLTTSTAQTNQALLNQISNTIQQRVFQHQVLTLQTRPAAVTPVVIAPVIRPNE